MVLVLAIQNHSRSEINCILSRKIFVVKVPPLNLALSYNLDRVKDRDNFHLYLITEQIVCQDKFYESEVDLVGEKMS